MLASLIAMAVMGQSYVYPARNGVPLTGEQKVVQARALAEFEARKPIIQAKLPEIYEMKILMMWDDLETYNEAMGRHDRWTSSGPLYQQDLSVGNGFRSVGVDTGGGAKPDAPTLAELKREHSLLMHHIGNTRRLYGRYEGIRREEFELRRLRILYGDGR